MSQAIKIMLRSSIEMILKDIPGLPKYPHPLLVYIITRLKNPNFEDSSLFNYMIHNLTLFPNLSYFQNLVPFHERILELWYRYIGLVDHHGSDELNPMEIPAENENFIDFFDFLVDKKYNVFKGQGNPQDDKDIDDLNNNIPSRDQLINIRRIINLQNDIKDLEDSIDSISEVSTSASSESDSVPQRVQTLWIYKKKLFSDKRKLDLEVEKYKQKKDSSNQRVLLQFLPTKVSNIVLHRPKDSKRVFTIKLDHKKNLEKTRKNLLGKDVKNQLPNANSTELVDGNYTEIEKMEEEDQNIVNLALSSLDNYDPSENKQENFIENYIAINNALNSTETENKVNDMVIDKNDIEIIDEPVEEEQKETGDFMMLDLPNVGFDNVGFQMDPKFGDLKIPDIQNPFENSIVDRDINPEFIEFDAKYHGFPSGYMSYDKDNLTSVKQILSSSYGDMHVVYELLNKYRYHPDQLFIANQISYYLRKYPEEGDILDRRINLTEFASSVGLNYTDYLYGNYDKTKYPDSTFGMIKTMAKTVFVTPFTYLYEKMKDFAKLVFNLSSTQVVVSDAAIRTAYTVLVLSGYTFSPFFTGMWDIYRGVSRFLIPIARFRSYLNQNLNYRDMIYREMGNYLFNHVIDLNLPNVRNIPLNLNRNMPLLRAPGGFQLPQLPVVNNLIQRLGREIIRGHNRAGEVFQNVLPPLARRLNLHRPLVNGFIDNEILNYAQGRTFMDRLNDIRQRWAPGH